MNSAIMQAASKLAFAQALAGVLVCLNACTDTNIRPGNKTSIQLQALQSKEFATSKKVAFASTLSVFQDLGYVIAAADLETGLITGKSPTEKKMMMSLSLGFGHKMQDTKATAFIEMIAENRTRVRLNFVHSTETSTGYGLKTTQDEPIEDPETYQESFRRIEKAIFVRNNL